MKKTGKKLAYFITGGRFINLFRELAYSILGGFINPMLTLDRWIDG